MSEANPYEGPRLVISNDTLGENIPKPALKGGNGGDRFDPMLEPRVKALEDKFEKMDSKLDTIIADLSYMKGRFESLPTAAAFGELKGRVDSLPTLGKIAALVGLIAAAMTIVLKWHDLSTILNG
ncbi:hypothetical protein NB311A_11957 [Nitrobacter sp. Nb-311A]|uniref:hypothetical protein n=1 Tax=Nitrobacter sp. Nb-311A TaxID=314253 RepID=UPI00006852D6|nr:hypothetical protein [Nitrobacter sp. Nb-311A]EAQ34455.1 hypothetical protein NB311A_11957 [Nitrobacter sp. Nb-311A]